MIKLDLRPTPLTYAADANTDSAGSRRLIVLIPSDTNYTAATRRIWELAHATSMNVELCGLCRDAAEESRLRRELLTMASLLQESKIPAETQVDFGMNWLDVLKTNYKTDDVIVCFAEQRTGLLRRPLSQVLKSNFNATVYILPGLTLQKPKFNRLVQLSGWLGSIVIVIGFGLMQAAVVQLPEGWLQNVLLILSIVPEFWLIWVWNSLFG